jgi:hypothetical protein
VLTFSVDEAREMVALLTEVLPPAPPLQFRSLPIVDMPTVKDAPLPPTEGAK